MPSRNAWHLKKEITLGVVIQLCLMASLIVGSWLNLERRIDSLQHDVDSLLKGQDRFSKQVEELSAEAVRHEYRLEVLEKTMAKEKRI
jgi:hypothetical protein